MTVIVEILPQLQIGGIKCSRQWLNVKRSLEAQSLTAIVRLASMPVVDRMKTLGVRADAATHRRLIDVTALLVKRASGADVRVSDAARVVLTRGLDAIEAELGITRQSAIDTR